MPATNTGANNFTYRLSRPRMLLPLHSEPGFVVVAAVVENQIYPIATNRSAPRFTVFAVVVRLSMYAHRQHEQNDAASFFCIGNVYCTQCLDLPGMF